MRRVVRPGLTLRLLPDGPEDHTDPKTGTSGIVGDATVLFRRGGGETAGEQPTIDWRERDPHGVMYLVDHTGTRRLRTDDAA